MVKLVRTSKRHRWNNFTLCNTDQGCKKLYYNKKFRDLKSFFVLGGFIVHTSDGASASVKEKKTWHVSSTVISNASVDACKDIKTLRFLAFSLALAFAIVFYTCEPFQCKRNQTRRVRKVCTPCRNAESSIVGTNQACFCVGRMNISFALCDPALMGQYHDIWRNPELYLQHQNHLKIIVKSA